MALTISRMLVFFVIFKAFVAAGEFIEITDVK